MSSGKMIAQKSFVVMTVQVTLPSNFCIFPSIPSFWLDLFLQLGPEFVNIGCGLRASQLSCLRLSHTRYYCFSHCSSLTIHSSGLTVPNFGPRDLLNHIYVQVLALRRITSHNALTCLSNPWSPLPSR